MFSSMDYEESRRDSPGARPRREGTGDGVRLAHPNTLRARTVIPLLYADPPRHRSDLPTFPAGMGFGNSQFIRVVRVGITGVRMSWRIGP